MTSQMDRAILNGAREMRENRALKTIALRIYRLPKVFQAVFQSEVTNDDRRDLAVLPFCVSPRVEGEKISRYYTMIMGTAQ